MKTVTLSPPLQTFFVFLTENTFFCALIALCYMRHRVLLVSHSSFTYTIICLYNIRNVIRLGSCNVALYSRIRKEDNQQSTYRMRGAQAIHSFKLTKLTLSHFSFILIEQLGLSVGYQERKPSYYT